VAVFYLLQENGSKITLENGAGSLILEASGVAGPTVFYQAGGAGHPVKRRKDATEELFKKIEHSLEVALGLVVDPVEGPAESLAEETPQPAWSDEAIREAVRRLEQLSADEWELRSRLERVRAMLRAYEEAREREWFLNEDEETWFLMS
jgi:hypothetical protein